MRFSLTTNMHDWRVANKPMDRTGLWPAGRRQGTLPGRCRMGSRARLRVPTCREDVEMFP